ncbi:MAG TPA: MBL fold metallo-hydrolase, partial [Clostridia bacterium]|nr:MBL fold metallo-hydrolase [Clostridia bacterium]
MEAKAGLVLGVSVFRMQYERGGVHLPGLGLWLDAHDPQRGADRVFVSHAHSDHMAEHREVILSEATARLMQARLPGERLEHVMDFRERRGFKGPEGEFSITLYPAGHIFGSAMSLIEAEGQSLLYTGDFKLRRGRSAEPCEPPRADVLVMETTFGRPRYVFPPTEAVLSGIIRFCREALDNEETPVLLGYSLGKSQEILCGLGEAGLPLMLHGTVFKLTRIYEQFGHCFPRYEPYEAGAARGKVLICPPNVVNSAMLRNLRKVRTAILTGWAVDQNCKYRYRCDVAFPLSDHADFPDLLELVRRVEPKQVYTLHGFAAEFAQCLRERGQTAHALSEDEQLQLLLATGPAAAPEVMPTSRTSPTGGVRPALSEEPAHAFVRFARTCGAIAGDARKLEKVRMLADYFGQLKGEAVSLVATWFTGRPLP